MSLIKQSATDLLADMNAGKTRAADVCQAFLDQIQTHDKTVRAFLQVDAEAALAAAAAIDARRDAGERLGPLAGLPVAVKDLLCTAGEKTTCGSKMLEHFVSPYDATAIHKLKAADAVLIGRTNMDEFAMGSSTENSAFGTTTNPWDETCAPGGSSGGAAACVAGLMAPLSIGTDTGGSIRQPAAFCGVTGMKPTYGRVSRFGLVAFASSLDQIGPLARTAADTALLLQTLAGHDPQDSTSANVPVDTYLQEIGRPLEGLRLGVVQEHLGGGLDAEVAAATQEALRVYESLGARIQDISLPHSQYGIATYYIIAPSEASSNLARYDSVHYGYRSDEKAIAAEVQAEREALLAAGQETAAKQVDSNLVRMFRKSRSEGFGPEVKRRIMLGAYALSAGYYDAYYLKALKVRRLIRNDYDTAFENVDLIVGPTTPTAAFKLGEKLEDPLSMYLGDLFTVTANLAGLPAISLPCGMSSAGLPIGLQLQAPPFQESRLLRAAHMFQQATDWHTKTPEL